MAFAALRVLQLASLDQRFLAWAEHLIVWGHSDLGRIVSPLDLCAAALGDPDGRSFPFEATGRGIGAAVRSERAERENGRAAPAERRACVRALQRRRQAQPDLTWAQLAHTEEGHAFLRATGKATAPRQKQREAIRNALEHLRRQRRTVGPDG
jgi:hypothetical protein